jgi:O-acetylserine/cysteine efflux transporter
MAHLSWPTIGAVGYIAYLSTLLGFAVWSWLLSHYPAATVAPFTLLVPVFGFTSSALALGEPLYPWKLAAAILIIAGLCINLTGARIAMRLRPA